MYKPALYENSYHILANRAAKDAQESAGNLCIFPVNISLTIL